MRVLLVEDDPILGDGLSTALRSEGYAVDWLKDGKQALQAIQTEDLSLVVLDLGLPGMDGLEVIRRTRMENNHVPVLILTARDATNDRVTGLDLGADDYLTKPFDLDELFARVRSLMRRSKGRATPELVVGDIRLNPAAHVATYQGQPLNLSNKEYSALHYLMEHYGRVVSRSRLEEQLYGWDRSVDSNALEVHIHNLRKKLGKKTICTIRGVGYKLGES